MQKIMINRIVSFLKIVFPLALLLLAGYEIQKFAKGLDYRLLSREMSQIQWGDMAVTLLVVAAAFIPMFFYDAIMVKLLRVNTPKKKLVKQSLIANTFSNLIGFGGLIGLMIRTYFYRNHKMDKKTLLTTIASVSLFYLAGVSVLSWIILVGHRDIPLLVNTKWLYLAVIGVALYLPVLLFFVHKKHKHTEMDIKVRTRLVLVSLCEWGAIFVVIWFLARMLHIHISFHDLFPIFIVASCAGIVSMIPGGLGSFDLVFIWGTDYLGIQDEKVMVLLMMYRIGYFFIPFIIAGILFLKDYWDRWNAAWNDVPNNVVQTISHLILTILIFVSGLLLLLSASVPGIIERLRAVEELLSLPIMNVSHQLTVAAGFILLGLSRGIEYKVKWVYKITLAVLSGAAVLSLFKGLDYEETIFLLVVVLLLSISKNRFYRDSYVLTWGRTIFDISVILIITSIYILVGYFNLPTAKLMPYVITDYKDLFFSAGIGLLIALAAFAAGYLLSRSRKMVMEKSDFQEKEIFEHVKKFKGNVLTHLIYLHDKYIYWNSKKTVLFSYQLYADKLVVLGDPVGERTDFPDAIEELQQFSDLYGYTPVFYEVSMDMMPYLHDNGFDFFKLGEEGFVGLQEFSLSGNKMKGVRAIFDKVKREGGDFQIIKPPFSRALFDDLREISDEWLQGRKEKGFSLGFFDESYLNKSDIAILKDSGGQIIGFASIMPVYDGETISVDLMRFKGGSSSATMDFIFLSLFEWAKQSGFKKFNLGMAPLSNVGLSTYSFLSEKIAAQIYLHGQLSYHFQGLRKFKEKYVNVLEPKYLAYRKKSSLVVTMLQAAMLQGKRYNVPKSRWR